MKNNVSVKGWKERILNREYSPALWLWIAACGVILLLSVSHTYNDLLITVKQSIHFWDLLGQGRPLDFYQDSIMYTGNIWYNWQPQGAGYPFLVYLVFAVWNFPLWLVEQRIGDGLLNSLPCLFWTKLLLMLAIALSARAMYRIVSRFEETEARRQQVVFAYLTGILLLSGTCIASQYDIITSLFILMGLDAWLQDKHTVFVACFAFAVGFKYFAFLPFAPLLLLGEKNLLKILRDVVLVWVPTLLLQLPFSIGDSTRGLVMGSTKRLITKFVRVDCQLGDTQFCWFILAVAAVCLWCYFSPKKPRLALKGHVFFAELAAMGTFCILAGIFPYWAVLAMPFFVLAAFCAPEPLRAKAVLCETAMSAMMYILHMLNYDFIYGSRTMLSMIWPRILGVTGIKFESVGFALFKKIGITDPIYFSAIMVLAWVALMLLCYPRRKAPDAAALAESWYEPPFSIVFYGRMIANWFLAFIPTIVFFMSVFEYYSGVR
ncbi:MAG: hypothetical protein LKJ90_07475 [Faecalibacterium sp.]|jgi:hypothetical protein|nr:hypothetical protein [Faecalibacterium sp.]